MKNMFFDENFKKSNHAPRRAHDLISGEKPNSCPPPPNPGWATAAAATATAEEFSQSIQAPSSMHPGISYPVRANPSLRYIYTGEYIYIYMYSPNSACTEGF